MGGIDPERRDWTRCRRRPSAASLLLSIDDFRGVELRVGTVTRAEMFEQLAQSRERILATPGLDPQSDWPEESARQFIRKIADNHDKGEGGRAQFEFFRNDATIRWSFASPPWFMRPGPRMGTYRITIDTLPLEGDIPAGIAVADMALAVAEEAESQKLVHQHWSAARTAVG